MELTLINENMLFTLRAENKEFTLRTLNSPFAHATLQRDNHANALSAVFRLR